MSTFSISPRAPYPQPTEPFTGGLQFQVNGTDVGPAGPKVVNLVGNFSASYDPNTGTLTITLGTG